MVIILIQTTIISRCHHPEFVDSGFIWLVVDLLCNAPLFGWLVGWLGNLQGSNSCQPCFGFVFVIRFSFMIRC